ncbi:MAG: tyrosine-type recombinase/integrase [Phycisphaerae bacterium]
MARAPWELTREMLLTQREADALRSAVRSAERDASDDQRIARRIDRLIIETLLYSGVRCSEFCKLRLCDGPAALAIPALRVEARAEPRSVWLPADVAKLIRDYTTNLRPQLLDSLAAQNATGPLIVTERGRPFERTGLYRRVVGILESAGLGERASVQLLRHTYGYLAYLRSGGNLLFVQRQLGHAHPMITSIYAQFVDEDYAALATRVVGVPRVSVAGQRGRHTREVRT